jgi:hypothetical protein
MLSLGGAFFPLKMKTEIGILNVYYAVKKHTEAMMIGEKKNG